MSSLSYIDMLSDPGKPVDAMKQFKQEMNNNNLPGSFSTYYQQMQQNHHQHEQHQNSVPHTQYAEVEAMKSEVSKPDVHSNSSYSIERFIDQPKQPEGQDPAAYQPQTAGVTSMYGGYYQGGYVPSYYYNHVTGGYTPWMGTHGQPQYYPGYGQQMVSDVSPSQQGADHVARNETMKSVQILPVEKNTDIATNSMKPRRRNRTSFSQHQMERLEELLEENRYPDVYRREEIARELDLEEDVVRVWFKNRRAKAKKMVKRAGAGVCKPREISECLTKEIREGVAVGLPAVLQDLERTKASNISPSIAGLHPVFLGTGLNITEKAETKALVPEGSGMQYMTRPSEYYGDFNRDTSLSDSSASSICIV